MGEYKIWIGGLPHDATSQELEDAFYRFGRINKVWVARRPPGFAFVWFDDLRDAEDAVRSMDGGRVCGVRARVEMSTQASRGGGGGGRGYGGSRGGGGGGRYDDDRDRDRGRRRQSRSRSRSPRRSRTRSPTRSRSRSPKKEKAVDASPEAGGGDAAAKSRTPSRSRSRSGSR